MRSSSSSAEKVRLPQHAAQRCARRRRAFTNAQQRAILADQAAERRRVVAVDRGDARARRTTRCAGRAPGSPDPGRVAAMRRTMARRSPSRQHAQRAAARDERGRREHDLRIAAGDGERAPESMPYASRRSSTRIIRCLRRAPPSRLRARRRTGRSTLTAISGCEQTIAPAGAPSKRARAALGARDGQRGAEREAQQNIPAEESRPAATATSRAAPRRVENALQRGQHARSAARRDRRRRTPFAQARPGVRHLRDSGRDARV